MTAKFEFDYTIFHGEVLTGSWDVIGILNPPKIDAENRLDLLSGSKNSMVLINSQSAGHTSFQKSFHVGRTTFLFGSHERTINLIAIYTYGLSSEKRIE